MREGRYIALSPHGFHRAAYTEWGEADNPRVVVCVHGLTRNSRDFDFLAQALAKDHRVVCPDVLGRGKSEWLTAKADYGYPLYVAQMATLVAHLNVESVAWVGTSMGGIIGMTMAALPGSPITRMVLNDVGAFVPQAALERLGVYVGLDPVFADVAALEAHLRKYAAPFGPLTDAQWRHLAETGHYLDAEGQLRFAYDPAIGAPFRVAPKDIDLSALWNAVRCPVLIIRGAESDLLLAETVRQMQARPGTAAAEIAGVGHAPMLMDRQQTDIVRDFLAGS